MVSKSIGRYIVRVEGTHQEKVNGILIPTQTAITLTGETDDERRLEDRKVIEEVGRIMGGIHMPKKRMETATQYLDSVGYEMDTSSGKTVVRRREKADNKEANNPNRWKKTHGELVCIPERMGDVFMENEYLGQPEPLRYLDNDMLRGNGMEYRCTTHVPKRLYEKDFYSPRFHGFDTVHFYWHATCEENMVEKDLYSFGPQDVICASRAIDGGVEIMTNDMILLVEPIYQTEEEIKTASGILSQSSVQSKPQIGTVAHGKWKGETIFFELFADMEIDIRGKKYLVVNERNVTCLVRGGKPYPVDGTLIIRPFSIPERSKSGLFLGESHKYKHNFAEVLSVSDADGDLGVGDTVLFFFGAHTEFLYADEKVYSIKALDIMGKTS